ncbi:MAG: hypothetical protein CVU44_20980 [Chloroflexi bacterium HGW-Chloroflexi-6]|nr:MAG: hypothetical protein CVU44_20980 [Chloroflexi bacterium HGW-Chloroflexi-6]
MEFFKRFSWQQVVLALAGLGIISSSDPDAAVISVAAMVIVALFGLASKALTKPIGRGWLTITVYAFAFGLAMVAHPPAGGFPIWTGDPSIYMAQLAALLAEFGVYAMALTGSATVLYNAILKIVVDAIDEKLLKG